MSSTRMRSSMSGFTIDIDTLDDLAHEAGIPPNATKSLDWHWLPAEALHVTSVRTQADAYWDQAKNNRQCPPEIKDEYKILIKDFMAYDHGKVQPHHLLDKIADFGSISDCETVNVIGGTPLAKTPTVGGGTVVNEVPAISMLKNEEGQHKLGVVNPATPDSKALPPGIKFAKVCCFIGETAPTKLSQYTEIGNAKRGYFRNKFSTPELVGQTKLYAWYYAYYVNTKGVSGQASNIVKAEVIYKSA